MKTGALLWLLILLLFTEITPAQESPLLLFSDEPKVITEEKVGALMDLIYMPEYFDEAQTQEAFDLIDKEKKTKPEYSDAYILVDEVGGEMIVQAFNRKKVLELCKRSGITPQDFIMSLMTIQNQKKN